MGNRIDGPDVIGRRRDDRRGDRLAPAGGDVGVGPPLGFARHHR
ncbi:hypothetical protein [Saliphagus infecundisoli]|uniref:Uncharacterized protein n=1 Tax=Saliphagus infecundisoli TaxID=1849069 RepID=A0ABD5QAS7_9EURY|nr:hypothetical protein [Saliphagus infecundisoli]